MKEAGKRFFEQAYKLGDKRTELGLGWPIKGVSSELRDYFKIIKILERLKTKPKPIFMFYHVLMKRK